MYNLLSNEHIIILAPTWNSWRITAININKLKTNEFLLIFNLSDKTVADIREAFGKLLMSSTVYLIKSFTDSQIFPDFQTGRQTLNWLQAVEVTAQVKMLVSRVLFGFVYSVPSAAPWMWKNRFVLFLSETVSSRTWVACLRRIQ